MADAAADRNLLFGLRSLQNGLIDRSPIDHPVGADFRPAPAPR